MKLVSVRLENFRQYFGVQELTFSTDRRRHVTVVHGVNGAGKTSLFLAINWCLYGEDVDEVREWKKEQELHRLVSKEALSRADVLQAVDATVELVFTHGDEKYRVERRLTATKQQDETIDCLESEHIMQIAARQGSWQPVQKQYRMGKINAILPSNVRTYFFFDGEKIDNFAKPEAGGEVRDAIYNVMKLEILDRGMRDLTSVAREYRSKLKEISKGEVSELSRQEKADKEREAAKTRRVELDHEIIAAREQMAAIDQRLSQMQNARVLQERRAKIEHELEALNGAKGNLVAEIRKRATASYAAVATSAISDALAILEQKRERGEIPSGIREVFIRDLLERMECICGQCLTPDSPGYTRLVNLLSVNCPDVLEADVLSTNGKLSRLQGAQEASRETLKSLRQQRVQLLDEIQIRDEELADLSEQLKDSPHEEISQLEKKRHDYDTAIRDMHTETGRHDERIESLTKEIERLSKEIEKADKDKTKENLLTRKMTLAQRAADAIEATQGRFADEMRTRIERKTQEIFKTLVWKDSHFESVRLGPDYKLEVFDRYGMPARADFSAGERQVLSLSFITAMSRVSIEAASSGPEPEEGSPLVMDTPFGRLSSGHRNSITEHLPNLAPQLVLFVTDEELRDQSLHNLQPRIGAEYRLNFDRDTSCTTIEKEEK